MDQPTPSQPNAVERSRQEPKPQIQQIDEKIKDLNDARPKPQIVQEYNIDGPVQREVDSQVDRKTNSEIDEQIKAQQLDRQRKEWALNHNRGKATRDFNQTRDRDR